jgi:hypothetical protein
MTATNQSVRHADMNKGQIAIVVAKGASISG